jgi:hypothetical protein
MLKIVGIACEPERFNTLSKTIESLYNQADQIVVYVNAYHIHIPDELFKWELTGRVLFVTGEDKTDLGKFYALDGFAQTIYFFTADSDIIYPPDYIQHTKELIDKYGTIITYHGRRLTGDLNKYYKGRHTVYDFRGAQDQDVFVDVGGTGVMGFRTDIFNPVGIHLEPYKCMSDLVLSRWAKNENKKIICAARKQNWLIQQEVTGGINQIYANNDSEQVKLMRQIIE